MDNNNNEQEAGFDVINAINGGDLFERIYLGQTLVNIPHVSFRLIIDASVTMIDENACLGCITLTEVIFRGTNVTQIGRNAFRGCRNLQRIELPAGLLRLESFAFDKCTSLQGEIVIPASVQFIGNDVFRWCKALERVVFAPTANVELGVYIFSQCSNLWSVTLPRNLQSIPIGFFENCTSLTNIRIPVSVTQFGEAAFCGSGLSCMQIVDNDGIVAHHHPDVMPGTIMLPPNLRTIPNECFENCKSIAHVQIPESVEEIEEDSFCGSSLQSIVISENVHHIRWMAFQDCSFLERVTIHSSNNLTMADNIFANCPALSVIKMYPWMWPKLFASMNEYPDFILKFCRHYQTQIFDFETPDVSARLFRRLRRDRKRTATMMDDG